ncbi:glycosyltransferase family 2 protein [Pseudoalteromonas prydzensis]|uniref:glycosyltransferase family 2 protein n=1 Tax=Pseudoalteromonas prydzensis TaxID=182141 RepID=UPI0007E502EC|nr:glycosyltransferase [Pseudoalteromonas prydzensis]MBE0377029.1 alpha-1,6-rhamnosyltransferase [Pseudoalteromonas prydzensis ACAM 620]
MTKLSIIVPVYNTEKYIADAIFSFFNQYQAGVELIIINDGSSDSSLDVINSTLSEINNPSYIRVYSQDNQGVSVARNNAIKRCTGGYISFLDADDLLLDNYLSEIIKVIDNKEPEIIEFGFCSFIEEQELNNKKPNFVHNHFGMTKIGDAIDDIYSRSVWYPTIRVFKSSLVSGDVFPKGVRFCEDLMALSKIYQKVENVYQIDKALYGYRINAEGATLNVKPDYFDNLLLFYNSLPSGNLRYLDYLRINLAYILYRCSEGKKPGFRLKMDFLLLFIRYLFDEKISYRKKMILLSSRLYDSLKYIKGLS